MRDSFSGNEFYVEFKYLSENIENYDAKFPMPFSLLVDYQNTCVEYLYLLHIHYFAFDVRFFLDFFKN